MAEEQDSVPDAGGTMTRCTGRESCGRKKILEGNS